VTRVQLRYSGPPDPNYSKLIVRLSKIFSRTETTSTIEAIEQSLAADSAIACFSSNLIPFSLNADRAPHLKASVRRLPGDVKMFVRVTGPWLILLCVFSVIAPGQEEKSSQDLELFGVSPKLHARLEKRLSQFIECQRSPDCQALDSFVAGYYFSDPERKKVKLTRTQKQSLAAGIKQSPILGFTMRRATGSTINFNVPLGKRVWWIEGCAEIRHQEQIERAMAQVNVYYQRDWLFSPIAMFHDAKGSFVPCKNETAAR
jgi:hypothetical protein